MNAKGTFNHSSLQIVKASEPTGYFPSRQYYVVTEGLRVGVFHNLSVTSLLPIYTDYIQRDRSEVHQSIDLLPKLRPLWTTCKTWANAVQTWDIACWAEKVHILRNNSGGATASAAASSTHCVIVSHQIYCFTMTEPYPSLYCESFFTRFWIYLPIKVARGLA